MVIQVQLNMRKIITHFFERICKLTEHNKLIKFRELILIMKKKFINTKSAIITFFIATYVLLFEFILPANKYFPKPTILIDTFKDLFTGYNFIQNLFYTTTIVYFAILVSIILILIFKTVFIKLALNYPLFGKNLSFFKFIPVIVFAIIWNLWFEINFYSELLFLILANILIFSSKIFDVLPKINTDYIYALRGLSVNDSKITNNTYWKIILPKVFGDITFIHLKLWLIVLIIEFISVSEGIGKILYDLNLYKDISGIFVISILLSVLILFFNKIIIYIKEKLIFWEP